MSACMDGYVFVLMYLCVFMCLHSSSSSVFFTKTKIKTNMNSITMNTLLFMLVLTDKYISIYVCTRIVTYYGRGSGLQPYCRLVHLRIQWLCLWNSFKD